MIDYDDDDYDDYCCMTNAAMTSIIVLWWFLNRTKNWVFAKTNETETKFSDGQYDSFISLEARLDSKLWPVHYDAKEHCCLFTTAVVLVALVSLWSWSYVN